MEDGSWKMEVFNKIFLKFFYGFNLLKINILMIYFAPKKIINFLTSDFRLPTSNFF